MRRCKTLREKRKKGKLKNKLTYGIVAVSLIFIFFLAYLLLPKNSSSNNHTSPPKAALVDHLSFSSPPANETFNDLCETILEGAGFSFTYYSGDGVTVSFYKNLPNYDYSLLVLRVHSAVIKDEKGNLTNLIGLFTSEVYNETTVDPQYLSELQNGRLALAHLFVGRNDTFFGITPFFVQSSMLGQFRNTVIIMMGCEGLNRTSMADALVQRGAKVYISWTGLVEKSHTDDATIRLLQSLLQQNKTIKTAVKEISHDPTWTWSELNYYPSEGDEDVGDNVIKDFISGLTLTIAEIGVICYKICLFSSSSRFEAMK